MNADMFKQCPACRFVWTSREQFLEDPMLNLVGYQVNVKRLSAGLFLFNHSCIGSTLAVQALAFRDLYQGPVFSQRLSDDPSCPGHCLRQKDLQPCPLMCECSYVREILQIVSNWPKQQALGEEEATG